MPGSKYPVMLYKNTDGEVVEYRDSEDVEFRLLKYAEDGITCKGRLTVQIFDGGSKPGVPKNIVIVKGKIDDRHSKEKLRFVRLLRS